MRPTDSGIGYELSRTFAASPDALFDALTSATVLKRIWGVQEIDVDARVGGRAIAIYVADITYRSEVIQLHIDLLANTRAPSRRVERSRLPAEPARTPGRGAGRRTSRLRLLSS